MTKFVTGALDITKLRSSSHYDVAGTLSDALIAHVATTPEQGGAPIATVLREVRDAVWSPLKIGKSAFSQQAEQQQQQVFDHALAQLHDASQRRQFLEAYARMGHIYELSGLIARENTVAYELNGIAPGGVREFVASCDSAQQAADGMSKPVFEMVMTAHPTNVNALDSIKAQRALGMAVDAARSGKTGLQPVEDALAQYLDTPLLTMENGEMENLTVQDETEMTLYYLGNAYDDLPMVYGSIDSALRDKGDYDALSLNLKLRFASWGSSGDKDGNSNVTADTTLDAIARHKCALLDRYATDLAAMDMPALAEWRTRIETMRDRTRDLQTRIIEETKRDGHLPPAQFDALSAELADCSLDAAAFARDAKQAYRDSGRQDALELVRRIRVFGGSFARIEYRETAEEYDRVVSELIPGYAEQSPEERSATLTKLLQQPHKAAELYAKAKTRLERQGAGKAYDAEDAAPITYQTLKRMELARDFPDMIRDNVLAEYTHPSQLLEAVFLQAAVEQGGKQARLGVVPLFESPESMQAAAQMMDASYHNPAYRAHMRHIAARDRIAEPVQQVQIAHSDNARRSGLPAARAFIHQTHHQLRKTAERNGVKIQFFEGGSSSDIFRGGVRAVSAAVRAYGLQDFAKFTYQGGDMLNYLNYPASTKRLFVRNFAHSAAFHVHGAELKPTASWQERAERPKPARHNPALTEMADAMVCEALKGTLDDYRDHAFTRAGLGHLLRELEYDEEKLAGTAGSRAPARKPPEGRQAPAQPERIGFTKVDSTQAASLDNSVDITKTRTITFSESLQHGGLVPTIVGSRTIHANLQKAVNAMRGDIRRKRAAGDELTAAEKAIRQCYPPRAAEDAELSAEALRFLFKQSRLFRDVTIRLAIGVALTDFEGMRQHHPRLRQDPFLDQLEDECRDAARLACAALTGEYPEQILAKEGEQTAFADISTNRLRHLMVARFPEMQQVLEDKSRYMGFLQALKADGRDQGGMDAYSRRLAHAAGDTVTHGRMIPTDDPAIGRYLRHQLLRGIRAEADKQAGRQTA